jgi:hypothetical protein
VPENTIEPVDPVKDTEWPHLICIKTYMATGMGTVATTLGVRNTPISLNTNMRFSTGTYTGGTGIIPVQTGTAMKVSDLRSRARTTPGTVLWNLRINTTASSDLAIWMNSVDIDENVYSIIYTNSADRRFYNSDQTLAATSTNALGGGSGVFLVKYNQNGTLQWYTRCDGTTGTADDTYGVWAESMINSSTNQYTSNVYNIFTYSGTSGNVYNASNQTTPAVVLTGASATVGDMGIAKFNSAGTVIWATRITSAGAELGRVVKGDLMGNVYAIGFYNGTASIYSASNQGAAAATLSAIGGRDLIIVKFDANGNYLWCAKMGNSTSVENLGTAGVDKLGNLYVAGFYQTSAFQVWAAGGASAAFSLPITGSNDGFIAKYNSNGTVSWATKVSGPTTSNDVLIIAVDQDGNSYLNGYSSGASLSIFSTTNYTTAIASLALFGGVQAGIILKYNSSGVYQWGTKYGKASTVTINSQFVAVDQNGDVYGTAFYNDSGASKFINFYNQGGTASVGTLTATAVNDAVLWKYNSSGVYQWSARVTSTNLVNPTALSIVNNAVFLGGYTTGTTGVLTMYNASGTAFATTITTATASSAWMAKYSY